MAAISYPLSADFIIVGGGAAGLSFGSRLSKRCPSLDILVLEGAPDQTSHPLTQTPEGAFAALSWIGIMIPFHRSNRMTEPFALAQVNLYRVLLLLIMAYGYAGQRMTMTGGQIWSGMTVGAMIVFFLEWELIPHAILQPGIQIDNRANYLDAQADTYSLLLRDWAHTETVVLYALVSKMGKFPYDGTVITASLLAMQNTSRGKITIASADVTDHPLIDPNFYTTKTDRVVIRHGIRRILRLMQETSGEKDMVASLIPEGVQAPLTTSSTDEDIDEHVKSSGHSWNHPAGTAAMETAISPVRNVHS